MFFAESELSLELLGVFKIKRIKSSMNSINNRSYDSLSVRLSGSGQFLSDKKTYILKYGDLLYIPRNAHYHQITNGETIIAIHFINYSHNKNTLETISVNNYVDIETLILAMYNAWNEKKQGYKYKCTSILYQLLYLLNQQMYQGIINSVDVDKKLNNAVDYIHIHFRNEQIPIAMLAGISAISETYFRKLFKKIYSTSPSQYIINLRLEYASQLLQSKMYTIAEVSEKSGFNDAKYFSKLFKRRYEKTPKEYQNVDLKIL